MAPECVMDPQKREVIRAFTGSVASRTRDVSFAIEAFAKAYPMIRDEYSFFSIINRFVDECPPRLLKGFVYRDVGLADDLHRLELKCVETFWRSKPERQGLFDTMRCEAVILRDATRAYADRGDAKRADMFHRGALFIQQLYIHAYREERAALRRH